MRRFFVNSDQVNDSGQAVIKGEQFHHLKNVSKLEPGEAVELLDGHGHVARAVIDHFDKKQAWLNVAQWTESEPIKLPRLHLAISVPRFQKMDLIIQKSVELGAASVTPLVSDRSFVRSLKGPLAAKMDRWQKIADEACKQCGRPWAMALRSPLTLENWINETSEHFRLFLYEGESETDIKTALRASANSIEDVSILIGSEGGFSLKEVDNLIACHLHPVTLGPLVLRVETACITILSVLQFHFDLMK